MPRCFEVCFDSPASVEKIHAAFGAQRYWLARIAALGGEKTLQALSIDSGGTVCVTVTEDLRRSALPGLLAKIYRGDLTVETTETWRPAADDCTVAGEISVEVTGAPGSGHGVAVLAPSAGGSRLRLTATVTFGVPVVGGPIESYVAGQFADGLSQIQQITTDWIGKNG